MPKDKFPVTPAVRALRAAGIVFEPHLYDYVERGGTRHAAVELNVDKHQVVKTLVLEDNERAPLLVLMHGDREVATGQLAKAVGVKSIQACRPDVAQKHTGYLIGGTSPFGTRTPSLPVYAEQTLFDLPRLFINGGKRGFLVSLAPNDLRRVLGDRLRVVEVAAPLA
jgi:Cys-tRNA(Pro) deacylase